MLDAVGRPRGRTGIDWNASATVRVNALGLQMYTAKVSRATALRLVNEGYDVARVRMLTRGARVDRC